MTSFSVEKKLSIFDEQDSFLVIDKPPGLQMHDSADGRGLIRLLREQLNMDTLYPVHRLDAITSGLLLVARGEQANRDLSRLFEMREVSKIYVAISERKPQKKQGVIVGDMLKTRKGSWRLARSQENPARTRFLSYGGVGGKRVFVLRPHTGKTHQLRVAMKSISSPILGDTEGVNKFV